MMQQVTSGIKISVKTSFEGTFYQNHKIKYAFSYEISIENLSNDVVQLNSRYWKIKDALNTVEVVKGEGVVGQTPILQPGEFHTYASGCVLHSAFGSMRGYYNMTNFSSSQSFKVFVPSFKLSAPFSLN
jgi:ApaG protein